MDKIVSLMNLFSCRKGWSMLYDWETTAAGLLTGMEVWLQCSALMVCHSPSAPAAWVAMGPTRREDRSHRFFTTGNHEARLSLHQISEVFGVFFWPKFCLMAKGVSMMGISSPSCWAKPMRRTKTVAELSLWSVLWSELQRTCFTGHLLLMVIAKYLYL